MGKISIYTIKDEPIGEGGMGRVFLGYDPQGNRVAIKEMRAELTTDANLRTFFHREVNTLKQLEHQSIVNMYASFEEQGNLYLVMEYVEGETVQQYIGRNGRISESYAIQILCEALPAIAYLHQKGFVHRDIKPSNIMIRPNGKICLLDFGIVKDMKHSSGHTVNQIIGTDGYMSVEQAEGLSIDQRSDIYSLGCVLYYMLVGDHAIHKQSNDYSMRMTIIEKPFPRAKDFNPALSNNIQRILDRATHKNMLQRFQSCREFELELSGGETSVVDKDSVNSTVSVGREGCDINFSPSEKKISRHHLDIEQRAVAGGSNQYIVRDRSTNGTVVNGEKIHNSEKTITDRSTPSILLAGEVNLDWNEVQRAFSNKNVSTRPPAPAPVPTSVPASKPSSLPSSVFQGYNATGWVVVTYIFAVLGGWLGIVFGLIAYSSKTVLADGKKVPKYKKPHRVAALIGTIVSGVSATFWTIFLTILFQIV